MKHTESGIDIDLTFGRLSFELTAIEHSEIHDIGGLRGRLPRVEDLLIMKAIARRPKDLQDIEGLLAAHPEGPAFIGPFSSPEQSGRVPFGADACLPD